jgi:hypothetical protein
LVTFHLRGATKASRDRRSGGAKSHPGSGEETVMNEMNVNRTYAGAQFGAQPGERWRKFLERVGTRSNDFAARLSRARFVYLHRREAGTHWLPL